MMNIKNTNNNANTIENLEIQISLLKQELAETQVKLNWYEEQQRLNAERRFCRSSEKQDHGQLTFFNEAEVTVDSAKEEEKEEPTLEEVTYKRRKKNRSRKDNLENLPSETIEYKLKDDEKVCECCNGELHEMSKQTKQQLKIIPAQFKVINHVQYIYSCRNCEKNDVKANIKKASMPELVLPGSIASPSAIAYVISQKFVDSMPLYRLEQHFARFDLVLSRQTMSNWLLKSTEQWLSIIYESLHQEIVKRDIIMADETTLQVLKEDDRAPDSKSYMWLYRTGRDGPHIILYEYQTTRAGKYPQRYLQNFSGFLCCDGYAGYHKVENVTLIGCWAHARRGFTDALKAMPSTHKDLNVTAKKGLEYCSKLFAIERTLENVSSQERFEERLRQSKPVLDEFYDWLKYHKPRVLPKSMLGKAINYCLNQWNKLIGFLEDGRLEISNNRAERSIKPFVISRKNFLFCNTPRGANVSAIAYSIVETAKENNLNPFEYLKYLFNTMPNVDVNNPEVIKTLLPWSETLPDYCKVSKSK